MNLRKLPILLVCVVLAVSSLACNAVMSGGSTPVSAGDAPATAVPATDAPEVTATVEQDSANGAIAPATMTSKGPGMVCLGSRSGLNCLDEAGWQVYNQENSEIGSDYLLAGSVCPDGSFALAHINGVSLFDGKSWQELPAMDSYSSPEAVACADDGSVWVAHFQGVSHFAGGQWKTYGSENFANGSSANELVYDVRAGADGRVWVLTSRSVALFENDAWVVYQEDAGFSGSRFFNAMTLDSSGRPWAAHGDGVDVFEKDAWQPIKWSDYVTPQGVVVDARGNAWVGTLSDGVLQYGTAWKKHNRKSEALASDSVNGLAADASGRVWVGTSYGLSVFDGAGWQTFLMNNTGLADNDVRFVLVTNDGPSLPALDEKEKGSLTGKLEDASNTPMSGMRVEICVETLSSTFSGDTPCSDQPFFLFTETDENGVFLIENVPTGYYVIVAETGTGWAQLTDTYGITSERTFIEAGQQYDIGTLTLEK